jgi:hypothetical protein
LQEILTLGARAFTLASTAGLVGLYYFLVFHYFCYPFDASLLLAFLFTQNPATPPVHPDNATGNIRSTAGLRDDPTIIPNTPIAHRISAAPEFRLTLRFRFIYLLL